MPETLEVLSALVDAVGELKKRMDEYNKMLKETLERIEALEKVVRGIERSVIERGGVIARRGSVSVGGPSAHSIAVFLGFNPRDEETAKKILTEAGWKLERTIEKFEVPDFVTL